MHPDSRTPQEPAAGTPADFRPVQKPAQVTTAVRLLWTTLGLGLVNAVLEWRFLTAATSVGLVLSTQVLTFAILAWLTIKISRGRNWARITYLALLLVGLPVAFLQFPTIFTRSPISGAISVAQVLLQVAALYLCFSDPGRRWFRREK